MNQKQWNKIME